MRSDTVELKEGQEIKASKTILFSKNITPNNDFIDLYNIIQRNVEVLERVEKLLEDNLVLMSEIEKSEIEKMYENAGVKQERMCEWLCKDSDLCSPNCQHYGSTQLHYPPFTTERQIAILCWLVNLKGNVTFSNKPKDITPERLQEALAWAVNQYWTKLTPEQQQQVKGILE